MKKRIESLGAALYKAGNEESKEVMLGQDNVALMRSQDFYMLWSLLFRTYCMATQQQVCTRTYTQPRDILDSHTT